MLDLLKQLSATTKDAMKLFLTTIEMDAFQLLCWVVPFLVFTSMVNQALAQRRNLKHGEQAPYVGTLHGVAPRFILNLHFASRAAKLLEEGYQKFKSGAFQLVLGDKDVMVLPASVLEELTTIPPAIASPHGALEHDLLGPYTGLDLVVETRLHHSIIQRKLTPRLGSITPMLQEELHHAFVKEVPMSSEWTEFEPYFVLGQVSARISAHAIVGPTFSRNPEWLDVAFNYTENLFRTIVILRMLPSWSRPVICHLLPSYRASNRYIAKSKQLLGPKVEELLQANDDGSWIPAANERDSNVLSWLSAMAKGGDRNADTIAHVQVIVALAAVHTVLLRLVNVLYDLTAHPDLIGELKEEIRTVSDNFCGGGWTPDAYDRLHKLDSVLRESQRMSPPTTTGLKRVFRRPYTFKNGLHVPEGRYVCMPIHAVENDPEHLEGGDPTLFDGLRSYRAFVEAVETAEKQGQTDDAAKEYKFSTPTPTSLNFGYGRSACPGRFFASLSIKMVFVKLLTEYEFRFLPGEARPSNLQVHEFLFTWPWQKMLIKRTQNSACPF